MKRRQTGKSGKKKEKTGSDKQNTTHKEIAFQNKTGNTTNLNTYDQKMK